MPVVFREAGLRIHFFAHEGLPREPVHVHVARPGGDAKFWLDPEVRLARNKGLTARELRQAQETVRKRRQELIDAWNAFFAGSD
ncbi:DUF4160 domain-containing protein [Sphingomonas sp. ID1715]|uniref:DUF4160 domain-containing protein n=1 Tax=Sphingomonas sp. ID1715 TaxID=1656898 RepID=UPI0014878334|nr:DUF4160 domain-containing protein [Sphingomonas sp. ID1715]NNM77151.1 DUF4160 domain-containing protein [Sphingomonas sp. ID1715]